MLQQDIWIIILNVRFCYIDDDGMTWWTVESGRKGENSLKTYTLVFVHHNSHMAWAGIEPRIPSARGKRSTTKSPGATKEIVQRMVHAMRTVRSYKTVRLRLESMESTGTLHIKVTVPECEMVVERYESASPTSDYPSEVVYELLASVLETKFRDDIYK